jgi:formylglycine-generating enzyme required for sulfatase activity
VSRIFLGHSSANEAEAIAIQEWLTEQGWDDIFLDLDPERGLKTGQRWQEALKRAAERCEVVIFLISPAWAASKWCLAEFLLAKQLNKPIFGVIVDSTPFADIPTEMTAEWQLVDLTAGSLDHTVTVTLPGGAGTATGAFASEGLNRLRIGLMQTALDPSFFKWPPDRNPDRAPYRGLKPLEADDAGIFFGREGPTVVALDMLRGLRDAPSPRLMVILGASGAGKSSFMRAGLLPRLERDDEHFLPLPVIRPERTVLTGDGGLIASLEQAQKAVGISWPRSDIRDAVSDGRAGVGPLLLAVVEAKARQLGAADDRHPPTIIIPVDQAEELFTADGAKEGALFLALLRELITVDLPAAIALFTIRSDNYEALQTAPALDGIRQHTFSLPPMPQGNYATVITGPPARLTGTDRALVVEEPLVQALLTDIDKGGAKDALPLLSFTLERLYLEFHGAGRLTEDQYVRLGRIGGSIEAAIERAFKVADSDPRIPRDRQARLTLLRRGLIPWLAGIDPDTKAPRRRVARLSEIPAEARPLIDLLVEQRLLSTDVAADTREITVEPAHEALLRQWGLLQGWLAEDTGLLAVLDAIKRGARDWAANAKASSWLAHSSDRLRAAERLLLRPDLAANLEPTDHEYIAACQRAERSAQRRARRVNVLVGALAACVIAIAGLSYSGMLDQSYLKNQARKYMDIYMPTVLTTEQERALKPGGRFQECASCPEMVVVPAGEFMMGSGDGQDQKPPRKVIIAKAFAIGRFSVTFDEWDGCLAHGGCTHKPDEKGWGRGKRPVIDVDWEDARQYVEWLSKQTGKTYRLLTEAEWEYAARAGSTTRYPWGDEIGKGNANCQGCGSRWDGKRTAPAGSFEPNAFGLYDMSGNVFQWVEDCYHSSYFGAPTDGRAWTANCEGGEFRRVLRGGSWNYYPDNLRSADRGSESSVERSDYFGFRVARTLTP